MDTSKISVPRFLGESHKELELNDANPRPEKFMEELASLCPKVEKLFKYITDEGPVFTNLCDIEKELLREQYVAMFNYAKALSKRGKITVHLDKLPLVKIPFSNIEALKEGITAKVYRVEDSNITACHLFLPNGFAISYGESGCLNDLDFNEELGEKYALERAMADAESKLWFAEGYARAMHYKA